MFYSFYSDSPVGQLLMTSDGQNLTGLQMNKQRYNHIAENWLQNNDLPIFLQKGWDFNDTDDSELL